MHPLVFVAVVATWIVLSVVVAGVADAKGHGRTAAFLISLLISPLFGFLYAIALPDRARPNAGPAAPTRPTKAKCPGGCAVYLRPGERCRSCGRRMPE